MTQELSFIKPYTSPTIVVIGQMFAVQSGSPCINTIYPQIYTVDPKTGKSNLVFPSPNADLTIFSTSSAYSFHISSIDEPNVSYNENLDIYHFTFFGYNSAGNQFLFNYQFQPTTPYWNVIDAFVVIPDNYATVSC